MVDTKRDGCSVAGYGTAVKGSTLLNYAGVKPDLLRLICDAAKSKQGMLMPGGHMLNLSPDALSEQQPDYILRLSWDIADEVRGRLSPHAEAGTKFVIAIPELRVV